MFFCARNEIYESQVQERQHAPIYPTVYPLRHMLQQAQQPRLDWRVTIGLIKSVCENSAEILALGTHMCTRIWVRAMIGLLTQKNHC